MTKAQPRKRFSEDQILEVLKEHESGVTAGDLVSRHSISEATFYNWKAKYGGQKKKMSAEGRLRELQEENIKLRSLLVDAILGNPEIKALLIRK